MMSRETECIYCSGMVDRDALKCPHCLQDLDFAQKHLEWPPAEPPSPEDMAAVDSVAVVSQLKGVGESIQVIMKAKDRYNNLPSIQFTGFGECEKMRLAKIAEAMGFRVINQGSVPRHLALLVTGDAPGQKKLRDAQEYGVMVVTGGKFLGMAKIAEVDPESFPVEQPEMPAVKKLSPGDISVAVVGTPVICSKAHIFREAEKAGFFVYGYGEHVRKSLSVLVVGDCVGSLAERKARENGARIMSPQEFLNFIKKGFDRNELKQYKPRGTKTKSPQRATPSVKLSPEPIAAAVHATECSLTEPQGVHEALSEFKILVDALICDEQITRGEFDYLCQWLTKHDHLTESSEFREVFNVFADILDDGIVTEEELRRLKIFLFQYRFKTTISVPARSIESGFLAIAPPNINADNISTKMPDSKTNHIAMSIARGCAIAVAGFWTLIFTMWLISRLAK